jgi:hypothetical protein
MGHPLSAILLSALRDHPGKKVRLKVDYYADNDGKKY